MELAMWTSGGKVFQAKGTGNTKSYGGGMPGVCKKK